MKILVNIILGSLLLLVACTKKADVIEPTNNADFDLETLFTKDGCTAYRFKDGNYHYFVKCEKADTSTMTDTTESCGKGCSHTIYEEISVEYI